MWHTYNQLESYILLLFFTLSYVLIDEGLQMLNAEIRYYMQIRKDEIERVTRRKLRADQTLDRKRYVNFQCKWFSTLIKYA